MQEGLLYNKIKTYYQEGNEAINNIVDIFKEYYGEERVDLQNIQPWEKIIEELSNRKIKFWVNEFLLQQYNINPSVKITDLTIEEQELVNSHIGAYILKGVFGDLLNPSILIYFPKVKITNERGNSLTITKLFVKVRLHLNGTLQKVFLNRAEYTALQFANNYLHSHVSNIPEHDFQVFQTPCFGSGPIVRTMSTLQRHLDYDMWRLLCLEIDKFVHTESIKGVPYHYLNLLNCSNQKLCTTLYTNISNFGIRRLSEFDIIPFVEYFISLKKLKFNYVNNAYALGMSYLEFVILISNEFLNWFEKEKEKRLVFFPKNTLYALEFLQRVVIKDGGIYRLSHRVENRRYQEYIGRPVCMFKGEQITLQITNTSDEQNYTTILHPVLISGILNIILLTVNHYYGKESSTSSQTNVWFI